MKAQVWDRVVLTEDVPGGFRGAIIPKGTRGAVIEAYEQPQEGYAVDVALPDESLVGGFRYDSIIVLPDHFDVDIDPADDGDRSPD